MRRGTVTRWALRARAEKLTEAAMKLNQAIEALCVATRANGRSKATVGAYREKLSYLVAFLGDGTPVEDISTGDLRRYVASQWDRGDLSEHTIAGRVRALKRLFNWLTEEGIISQNPSERIKTPRLKPKEPKGISRDDFLATLATTEPGAVADVRDRAILVFLLDTGCRVGGLCGLRVQDIDLQNRLATLTEKGGKTRLVPFNRATLQALQDWLDIRPQGRGPWLFVGLGNRAHNAVSPNGVHKMLARRGKQAGVSGPVNPHSFRHGFAIMYIMSGGDLATLADLLGHSNVMITRDYYARFTVEQLRAKHERHSPIAQIFGGNDGDGSTD